MKSKLLVLLLSLFVIGSLSIGCIRREPVAEEKEGARVEVPAEEVRVEEPGQEPDEVVQAEEPKRSPEFEATKALLEEKGYITPETRVFGVGERVPIEGGTAWLEGDNRYPDRLIYGGTNQINMAIEFFGIKEPLSLMEDPKKWHKWKDGLVDDAVLLLDGKVVGFILYDITENYMTRASESEQRGGTRIKWFFEGFGTERLKPQGFEKHFPGKAPSRETIWVDFPGNYESHLALFKVLNYGLESEFRAIFIITREDVHFFE